MSKFFDCSKCGKTFHISELEYGEGEELLCDKCRKENDDECIITSGIKDEEICYGQLLDKKMKPINKGVK